MAIVALRLFKRPEPAPASFPAGRVGYAVGDIHGRADLLLQMLETLEARAADDMRAGGPPIAVFLGDYVDRGPDSQGVLDLLLSARPRGCECRFLRGNHEQLLMAFLDDPIPNRSWVVQGGAETLLSYGIQPLSPFGTPEQDWIGAAQLLRVRMPAAQYDFLVGLERYVELGDYAFVHAGVNDERPLAEQSDAELYWSRVAFLASKRPFSHRIVHGHTPVDAPYADQRRVAVDTGAYASGRLTAARFEGQDVSFITVEAKPTQKPPAEAAFVDASAINWG